MFLEQALHLPRMNSLFLDETGEMVLQNWLERLIAKEISWEEFLPKVEDLLTLSRLKEIKEGRTVLHQAVIDNRLDVIEVLKKDPFLKLRRDHYGLTAIEIARLLDRKQALLLLHPMPEVLVTPDLPKMDSFDYLSHPVFETKEGFAEVLAQVAKAKKEDKIPPEKIWMGIYYDKEICKGAHPPISIQFIDQEVGYGVFADKKISPCAFVGEYSGVIQERKPRQLKDKRHCLRYPIWEGKKNVSIDAEKRGNFTRFINHSSKPNIGLQSVYWRGIPRMIFVALKEIRVGAQLTFDYGPLFWKEFRSPPKEFPDDL